MRNNPASPLITSALARVTIGTITSGQVCMNTFDYLWSVPSTFASLADLTALGNAWDSALDTLLKGVLSPLTSLYSMSVAELHYGNAPTYSALYAPGTIGTAGATPLPLEMGVTLSRVGALKGQHGRGRVTMPAVPNTFTTPAADANKINATGLAAYLAFCNKLLLPLTVGTATWTHVISTRPIPPTLTVDHAIAVAVYNVGTVLGTARTRKEGRGI